MSFGVRCALDQLVSGPERSGCLRRRNVVDMYIGLDWIGEGLVVGGLGNNETNRC